MRMWLRFLFPLQQLLWRAAVEVVLSVVSVAVAVIEPLRAKVIETFGAVLREQVPDGSLAGPRRAKHRQEVAVPDLRHADSVPHHADDVVPAR